MSGSWRIAVTVPPGTEAPFAQALEDGAAAVASFELAPGGPWRVEWHVAAPPDRAGAVARLAVVAATLGLPPPEVAIAEIPQADWLAVTRASFTRLEISRIVVRPSHDSGRIRPGALVLTLDAGLAFGTGEHATTRACLELLQQLARPRRLLDLGTGSGILALAAGRLWPGLAIDALDVDADAVRIARANARANAVALRARRCRANPVLGSGRYGAVLANILARPLVRLMRAIARTLVPGGRAVLSGVLVGQERQVLNAARAHRLVLLGRRRHQGWSALVLAKPGQAA